MPYWVFTQKSAIRACTLPYSRTDTTGHKECTMAKKGKKQKDKVGFEINVNGKSQKVSFNSDEAEGMGFHSIFDNEPFPLGEILDELFWNDDEGLDDEDEFIDDAPPQPENKKKTSNLTCPLCGRTFKDFMHTGRFGCGACYNAFDAKIRPLMKQLHGADSHVGRGPELDRKKAESISRELNLKEELREAIAQEEYERAAEIRDKLKKLEEAENNLS